MVGAIEKLKELGHDLYQNRKWGAGGALLVSYASALEYTIAGYRSISSPLIVNGFAAMEFVYPSEKRYKAFWGAAWATGTIVDAASYIISGSVESVLCLVADGIAPLLAGTKAVLDYARSRRGKGTTS